MCLQHCLVPSFVGLVACSRPVECCLLGEDNGRRFYILWHNASHHDCCWILHVDHVHCGRAYDYGESICLLACPASPLGRVPGMMQKKKERKKLQVLRAILSLQILSIPFGVPPPLLSSSAEQVLPRNRGQFPAIQAWHIWGERLKKIAAHRSF